MDNAAIVQKVMNELKNINKDELTRAELNIAEVLVQARKMEWVRIGEEEDKYSTYELKEIYLN